MIYRRRRNQAVFAVLLAIIAVSNALFYGILTRPSQTEYATLQHSIEELQKTIASSQQFFTQLEKQSEEIAHFDGDKDQLFKEHMVARKQGYSEVVETLNDIVVKTGVKKTRVSYSLNPKAEAGLNPLSITIPVEGTYPQVVDFIRHLEDSKTIYLVTAIATERVAEAVQQPGPAGPAAVPRPVAANAVAPGTVQLALTLETYFYQ